MTQTKVGRFKNKRKMRKIVLTFCLSLWRRSDRTQTASSHTANETLHLYECVSVSEKEDKEKEENTKRG